jgi:hypothetical protein
LLEEAVPHYKTMYDLDHPATLRAIDFLIWSNIDMGRCDRAEALLQSSQKVGGLSPEAKQGLARREKQFLAVFAKVKPTADQYQQQLAAKQADHLNTLAARLTFASVLDELGQASAAAYHTRAVLDARRTLLGADHPDTLACQIELGWIRLRQKQYAEAELFLLPGYEGLQKEAEKNPAAFAPGTAGHKHLGAALKSLVQLYEALDRLDEADRWREELEKARQPSEKSPSDT